MKTITLLISSVLLLAACAPTASKPTDTIQSGSESSHSSVQTIELQLGTSSAMAQTGSAAAVSKAPPAAGVRTVHIDVESWNFSPNIIKAKKGEKVRLELTGISGIHSFTASDLGLSVHIEPGQTATVDLPTDKTGNFEAACRIPCGEGHRTMKAMIVIE